MKKPLLILTFALLTWGTWAQTDTSKTVKQQKLQPSEDDSVIYSKVIDTALMNTYGMRIYNPRIWRYMPAEDSNHAVSDPYVYTRKKAATRPKPKTTQKSGKKN